MKYTYNDYLNMLAFIRTKTNIKPTIGIVLGSGLDGILNECEILLEIPYKDIPGLPVSTNKSHKGQYVFAKYKNVDIVFMQGRLHYYEGYTAEEVVAPIRLLKLMGIKSLILSNACGGISFGPGTMMLISDHILYNAPSPLIGENIDEFGPRFPDMSDPYDTKDREIIYDLAIKENLNVKQGVYMQFTGPQYESKAEIEMAKRMGTDTVGMSTVQEAIAANQMGLKVIGIATISNWSTGIIKNKKLDDLEVIEAGKKLAPAFTKLLGIAISVLSKD